MSTVSRIRGAVPAFLITLLWVSGLHAAEPKYLDEYFARMSGFSADFEQTLFDDNQIVNERSRGIIAVQRPDRFRLEYREPYSQLYVADGEQLWFYDEDLEQVTVKDQEAVLTNTPAMLLSSPDKLLDAYEVQLLGEAEELTWFELTPKEPGGNFDKLALGFDERHLQSMELEDAFGQVTRMDFKNIRPDPEFPTGTFSFTPPEGVDVIRD